MSSRSIMNEMYRGKEPEEKKDKKSLKETMTDIYRPKEAAKGRELSREEIQSMAEGMAVDDTPTEQIKIPKEDVQAYHDAIVKLDIWEKSHPGSTYQEGELGDLRKTIELMNQASSNQGKGYIDLRQEALKGKYQIPEEAFATGVYDPISQQYGAMAKSALGRQILDRQAAQQLAAQQQQASSYLQARAMGQGLSAADIAGQQAQERNLQQAQAMAAAGGNPLAARQAMVQGLAEGQNIQQAAAMERAQEQARGMSGYQQALQGYGAQQVGLAQQGLQETAINRELALTGQAGQLGIQGQQQQIELQRQQTEFAIEQAAIADALKRYGIQAGVGVNYAPPSPVWGGVGSGLQTFSAGLMKTAVDR